ncbi:hypothetical protein [Hugenholtzia roseola]|uniref:hypothetical protein n=1 Tax=Hugenholtzia roseola TaxID=1002 RepID=UPI000479610E|nr:hypothetical protein [Hugenholtzia roseola]
MTSFKNKNYSFVWIGFLFALSFSQLYAQKKEQVAALAQRAEALLEKGNLLAQYEKATFLGLAYPILENQNFKAQLSGFVAYPLPKSSLNQGTNSGYQKNYAWKVIFYNKKREILFAIETDTLQRKVVKEEKTRPLTAQEKTLIELREKAWEYIYAHKSKGKNKAKKFRFYENTALHLVVFETPQDPKQAGEVWLLTAPLISGKIIFGNDYQLLLDKKMKVSKVNFLHQNIITIAELGMPSDNGLVTSYHNHSHKSSDFITPTDICALILYGKNTNWDTHWVFSKDFVSIFDVKKQTLEIMPRSTWELQYNDIPNE